MSSKVLVPRWLLIVLIVLCSSLIISMIYFETTIRYSRPTAMKLYVPKEKDTDSNVVAYEHSGTLTILLGKNDIVAYYEGELAKDGKNIQTCDFKAIRNVIVNKKQSMGEKNFVVVIKPSGAATYKNTVDMLDEMTIDDVKKYAMVDITPAEEKLINR